MPAANAPSNPALPTPQDGQFRNRVLEMLVDGAPLTQILETMLLGLEKLRPGALCSLVLLNPEGTHIERAVGPSLPDYYTAALVGLAIGPGQGSCGTAAYSRERVIVEDIATHPYWSAYAGLAARAALAACWSQPILSASGQVLGTFAIYHRTRHTPDAADLELIQQCAALACIAIEKDAEAQKLRESEIRYRTLVEWSPEPVLVHRLGTILYVNPSAVKTFGAADADALVGRQTRELIHPDFLEQQVARMHAIVGNTPVKPMVESRFLRLDGTPFDVEVQGTSILYQGRPAIHVVLRDITQRKQAEDKLDLAASVFSHAREGIVITDAEMHIVDANAAFTAITGYPREELLGTQPAMFRPGPHSAAYFDALWQGLRDSGHWSGEIWSQRKNGEAYAEMLTISAVANDKGTTKHYVALCVDITPMKVYQQQLESLAHFDALTQLPNRLLLADRLHQAMRQSQRRKQALAVVFLDLDGFKAVNDQHGHAVGDELLVVLSQRMKGALRDGDTLARIGGDEFVAVLVDLDQAEDAEPVLERILLAAADPVSVGEARLQVSASLGIAVFPRDGTHADLLLRRADQSMYLAKQAGRNRYHFFHEDSGSRALHADLLRPR
jgi:diguanylate cyclase (GGDEF)-like protein/PAS domain S-box-containing protein